MPVLRTADNSLAAAAAAADAVDCCSSFTQYTPRDMYRQAKHCTTESTTFHAWLYDYVTEMSKDRVDPRVGSGQIT